tara:strand:- start:414 stop:683 length:270 start_codon:yes stop_codon:yes gene_type:complete
MQLPIWGQEEDATDFLSRLMIHNSFKESSAKVIIYEVAFGFKRETIATAGTFYWDVHGPDEQRYYNLVCRLYHGNLELRTGLGDDLRLT